MTTIPDDMVERVARALREADIIWGSRRYPEKSVKEIRDLVEDASDDLGYEGLARAAIEAMQPAILAERERCVAEIAALREQLAESDRSAGRRYSILEPKGGWRSKEQFSEVERRKLLPIAETLALLDGNAFFTVGAENEWAFSYLPEADAIYQANGGDNGWAGEASFAKPFAHAIRSQS